MTANSKKQQYVKMPINEAFDEKTKHYLTFNTALLDTVLTIVEWVNVNKSSTRFVRQEVKRELNGLSRQILKVKATLGDRKGIIGGITPLRPIWSTFWNLCSKVSRMPFEFWH